MFHFSKNKIYVNNEQLQAITRPADVNQRIIASAGSGKTTTITARIAYLIEHHKVQSNRIVLLTFSRNSASQMKAKLYDLIGQNDVWAGTFHGLAKTLLQTYSPKTTQNLYSCNAYMVISFAKIFSSQVNKSTHYTFTY